MKTDVNFFIISRSVLLRMRNVSDETCRETRNTHFIFITFFFENRVVYEIMWKNTAAVQATDDNITWRMRIAYWMPKATYTYTQVV
jgi:hypothetical protein